MLNTADLMNLTPVEMLAVADAQARCVEFLANRDSASPEEAKADRWLAKALRTSSESVRRLGGSMEDTEHKAAERLRLQEPTKVDYPLSPAHLTTLTALQSGLKLRTDRFFANPRWTHPYPAETQRPKPAVVAGLADRGLINVEAGSGQWTITPSNRAASAIEMAKVQLARPRVPVFRRYMMGYSITQLGETRQSQTPVRARSEAEATKKLRKQLDAQFPLYKCTDLRVLSVSDT